MEHTRAGRASHKVTSVPFLHHAKRAGRSTTEEAEARHLIKMDGGRRAAPPLKGRGDAPRDQSLERVFLYLGLLFDFEEGQKRNDI